MVPIAHAGHSASNHFELFLLHRCSPYSSFDRLGFSGSFYFFCGDKVCWYCCDTGIAFHVDRRRRVGDHRNTVAFFDAFSLGFGSFFCSTQIRRLVGHRNAFWYFQIFDFGFQAFLFLRNGLFRLFDLLFLQSRLHRSLPLVSPLLARQWLGGQLTDLVVALSRKVHRVSEFLPVCGTCIRTVDDRPAVLARIGQPAVSQAVVKDHRRASLGFGCIQEISVVSVVSEHVASQNKLRGAVPGMQIHEGHKHVDGVARPLGLGG
mmetsp:Transcript_105467/g.215033  ORF Transcript_105467/g.215033 Transcript_105467/m.215033 type:complete len:262 (-) Transcript_105467:1121-1906(-)